MRGAELSDVIEIMQNYGAINAANLDGGTSTGLTVKHKLISDTTSRDGDHRSRPVATAFILDADEADNGDYSIIANKLN